MKEESFQAGRNGKVRKVTNVYTKVPYIFLKIDHQV